jgi:hypothetical protein
MSIAKEVEISDEEDDEEEDDSKYKQNLLFRAIVPDLESMSKESLVKLLHKIINSERNYTDDKHSEADATIEHIRELVYTGYTSMYKLMDG